MPTPDATTDTPAVVGTARAAVAAAARLARHLELSLGGVELTLPQFRLLMLLVDEPGVANQLARRTQVRPPSLTALVAGLVERGLVERRPDETDRRRVVLAATDDGRRVLDAGFAAVEARLTEVSAGSPGAADLLTPLADWVPVLDDWRDGAR